MCAPGMLRRWDDSQKYLSDHPHLVCEDTANYLVVICIDYEIDEVSAGRKEDLYVLVKKTLIQPGPTLYIFGVLAETCTHGARGPPGHRYAVHLGSGSDTDRRPKRLLQTVLLKDQGLLLQMICCMSVYFP